MPQVASTSVGSIRQKGEQFELISPDGKVMFSGTSPGEAQEFARSLQMPVREGTTGPQQPSVAPTVPGAGLSVFGQPGVPPEATQGNVAPSAPPATGGLQPPPGVSPLTAGRAQLPGPSEFTNLLKKVVDVKLGRRPFTIGISDEDLRLLTPSAVRSELGRRANDLLRQGADVSAIMSSYQGMYKDTLTVVDKYLADMQSRQKMLSEMAFTEPMLTRGVLPEALKSVLSPEEQAMWGEMSAFYKDKFAKGQVPEVYAHNFNEETGETTILYRDKLTGEVSQKIIKGAAPKPTVPKRVAAGTGVDIIPSVPVIPPSPSSKTWTEFLAEEQERRGMTIDPRSSLYRELQQQFAGTPTERLDDTSERQIARYSFPVQQVLRGKMEVRDLLVGGTAKERAQYSAELDDARAKGLVPEGSEFTTRQQQDINKFRSDFRSDPAYKDILDIETGWQGVQVGLQQKDGFGDIAAINAFQRMVDPGATVREGDVALLQQASALVDRWLSDYPIEKLRRGDTLPTAVRTRMLNTARQLFEVRSRNFNEDVAAIFEDQAKASGVPFNLIGRRFGVKEKSGVVDFGSYYE